MLALTDLSPGQDCSLLAAVPDQVEAVSTYTAAGGYDADLDGAAVLAAARRSGLRGRSGSGFPLTRKLEAVRDAPGPRRAVVVNGSESDPYSAKDRYLMRFRPHLVLDGAALAAAALGTRLVFVVASDPEALRALRDAAGSAPLGFAPRFTLNQGGYAKGEETAVVSLLNGGPPLPTFRPPRPYESGVAGLPTLVANVETMCCLALASRSTRPLPRLGTVVDRAGRTVLVHCRDDTTLGQVATAVGRPGRLAGVLPSGVFGGVHRWADVADLPLGEVPAPGGTTGIEALAAVLLDGEDCPVGAVTDLAHFLAGANARQCGSCRNGTAAGASVLAALARGQAPADGITSLQRWAGMLPGRGACAVPTGLAGLLRTLLERFPHEVAEHQRSPCPACSGREFTDGATAYSVDPASFESIKVLT